MKQLHENETTTNFPLLPTIQSHFTRTYSFGQSSEKSNAEINVQQKMPTIAFVWMKENATMQQSWIGSEVTQGNGDEQ